MMSPRNMRNFLVMLTICVAAPTAFAQSGSGSDGTAAQAEEAAESAGEAADEAAEAAAEADEAVEDDVAEEAGDGDEDSVAEEVSDEDVDPESVTSEDERLLAAEVAEREQLAAEALEAAKVARRAALSAETDAEGATAAAIEAEQNFRRAACALAEARGEECYDPDDEGVWIGYFDIGGSLVLNSTANVPGEARGLSVSGNAKVSGVLDYMKGDHEWRNSLQWDIGATRSASEEVWVKSIDRFQLTTGYYYEVTDWFGPFVEATLQTNFFPLEARRSESFDVCEGEYDSGTCTPEDPNALDLQGVDSFQLTSAFEPVTLNERFGVYAQLFRRTYFQWIARAGFGAQQFYVGDDAYVETSSGDESIEVSELDRFGIFGVMADTEIMGAANNELVQYGARAAMLYPFIDTNSDELDAADISPIQVDLGAFVNFSIKDWLGFRVTGEAYRQPQVTGDKWQTRINMLATFSYTLFGSHEGARDATSTLRYEDLVGADGAVDF